MTETVLDIVAAHRSGRMSPAETIARSYARIRERADPAIFIALRDEKDALREAAALTDRDLPLYGVPVAVKDNIDVEELPTTAACPAFSFQPAKDSTAVARLRAAGAIVIGKTNLDQFATGLVGVRSPYGVPRNPFDPAMIPGGSSSGSAVAVSAGIVPLSLGTDTAGSGRVPAGLNNLVGLKPTLGLISTSGVVPACRSLDCVSIFALTADDAHATLSVIAGYDPQDAYSRRMPVAPMSMLGTGMRIAVPRTSELHFFGDKHSATSFDAAIARAQSLGMLVTEIDFTSFLDAARLLYEGAWVAERYAAVGEFIDRHPNDIHPVTKQIVDSGAKPSAADAFRSFYKLQALRAKAAEIVAQFDALMVPTAPSAYTVAQLQADPVALNSNLGTYTNFVNLFDLCGLAVPVSIEGNGMPYGVTFLAPAGRDGFLTGLGRAIHAASGLTLGALGTPAPTLPALSAKAGDGEIAIAVVGAHLSGMVLNGELRTLNARLIRPAKTAKTYRLFALDGTHPPKPGMLRVPEAEGAAIEIEVWAMTPEAFGRFVSKIPSPLSIGMIELEDGSGVQGFLVEANFVQNARDISSFGGWRNFMAQAKAATS